MLTKNEIHHIQSLKEKKARDENDLFVVETPKLVDELLKSAFTIEKIYTTNAGNAYNKDKFTVEIISEKELQRISQLKTPNEVLAIVRQQHLDIKEARDGIILVLDGIQNPGNLGTIIRIADWFGIKAIIASTDTADAFSAKVVQATMGSIFRIPIIYKDLENYLAETSLPIYGALLNGENLFEQSPLKNGILIIGNESKGIRSNIKKYVQKPVTIPRYGKAESLNAGVATGILLSHLV